MGLTRRCWPCSSRARSLLRSTQIAAAYPERLMRYVSVSKRSKSWAPDPKVQQDRQVLRAPQDLRGSPDQRALRVRPAQLVLAVPRDPPGLREPPGCPGQQVRRVRLAQLALSVPRDPPGLREPPGCPGQQVRRVRPANEARQVRPASQ